MKKLSAIAILLFLFAFTSFAQRTYSMQNLEQVSTEDLNLLLKKAHNKKKAGLIVTATGSALFVTGLILESTAESHGNLGEVHPPDLMLGIGMWSIIVGVPFLVVGSSRVKKISKGQKAKTTTFDGLMIEIAPCRFHNYIAQNQQNGVTLRIKF